MRELVNLKLIDETVQLPIALAANVCVVNVAVLATVTLSHDSFAIETEESNGFDINGIGIILMVVGAIGLIASMVFWTRWGGYRGGP